MAMIATIKPFKQTSKPVFVNRGNGSASALINDGGGGLQNGSTRLNGHGGGGCHQNSHYRIEDVTDDPKVNT